MKKKKIVALCGSTKKDASNVKIIEKFAQLTAVNHFFLFFAPKINL
jgi:hypothetical protein